jgi:hypothetical protein
LLIDAAKNKNQKDEIDGEKLPEICYPPATNKRCQNVATFTPKKTTEKVDVVQKNVWEVFPGETDTD